MTTVATFFRILVGLIGVLSLPSVYQHWFAVDSLAHGRGLVAEGAIGAANIRADIGGIFLAIGLFAILAAWRQSRFWLLAAMMAVGSAITGRLVSLALDGVSDRVLSPIMTEAMVIAIMAAAWFSWRASETPKV